MSNENFYVVMNHSGLFWAYCEGWYEEIHAKEMTLAQAKDFIADMHPEYRARTTPMICQAFWTELKGRKTLAIAGI